MTNETTIVGVMQLERDPRALRTLTILVLGVTGNDVLNSLVVAAFLLESCRYYHRIGSSKVSQHCQIDKQI